MTILNVYLSEKEKAQLKKVVEDNALKSMSEFVRTVLNEQILIDAEKKTAPSTDFIIPDYIPPNKYILFTTNKSIAAIGDSPSQVAQIAAKMGIIPPFTIKFNGKINPQPREYIYSLHTGKAWHYADFAAHTYPIIDILFKSGTIQEKIFASIDTAASLCVIKEGLFNTEKLEKGEKGGHEIEISTAGGLIKKHLFTAEITILDNLFRISFVEAPLDESLPFNFLIGRNLLDQLDAFFLGLKQILLLKLGQK